MKTFNFLMTAVTLMYLYSGCGSTGFVAVPGPACTTAQAPGGVNITCGNSAPVFVADGSPGSQGIQGVTGETGSAGAAGQNGTSVTVVQLCPAPSATSFAEEAFCIGGKLYAENANNDGTLVYLPLGYYPKAKIDSVCSFTVEANCVVVNP